jgi:uncharacterized membrane protein YdjX (TVP38/TMEM64 family)
MGDILIEYAILFAVVLAVNLMPAFGPPTWSIIVLVGLNSSMPMAAVVLIAAVAAACGRFLLALATRWAKRWVSDRTRRNLDAAREAIEQNRKGGIFALALFALSPLPSAQLFEAAGLTGVRLLPFTLAFFAGRLVSYSIYAGSAQAVRHLTTAETLREGFSSPIAIAVQVMMLGALVALARIDWVKLFAGKRKD